MGNLIDLTGMKFGRWNVIKRYGKAERGEPLWLCNCSCKDKTIKIISGMCLREGRSTSCGCTAHKKYKINENYFDKIDTARKAFWFGFICADGGLRKIKTGYTFKIVQKDRFLLEQFLKDIESEHHLKETIPSKNRYGRNNFYELHIVNNEFAEKLFSLGKTLLKHDLKTIPDSVPKKFIMDFIRGYFEGDGSIYFISDSKIWSLGISGNYELLKCFSEYIENNITKRKSGGISKDRSIYKLHYSKNDTEKIMNALYYNSSCIGEKIRKYKNELR